MTRIDPEIRAQFLATRPWARSLWRPAPGEGLVLFWIVLIHITALAGLILFPIPSWYVALIALGLAWAGGIGTTVCYHRALAHKSLRLHPLAQNTLTFFAMLNGSGAPGTWSANHRLHHATSDTVEDISSPRIGGFWWAHLRWLWQAGQASVERYCPDMDNRGYRIWNRLQVPVLIASFMGGLLLGWEGFFWVGAIRLVFSLHAQCFVNSICHMGPEATAPGRDSSVNVPWLAICHLAQGENWHGNHHSQPWSARLGLKAWQIDAGWYVIWTLEKARLAYAVRRPHHVPPPPTGRLVLQAD